MLLFYLEQTTTRFVSVQELPGVFSRHYNPQLAHAQRFPPFSSSVPALGTHAASFKDHCLNQSPGVRSLFRRSVWVSCRPFSKGAYGFNHFMLIQDLADPRALEAIMVGHSAAVAMGQ